MITIVEKVLLLQEVDIFEHTSTEDLAHIAAITSEVEFPSNSIIYQEGDLSDAMYFLIEGKVVHLRDGKDSQYDRNYFGSWALLDQEPRVATAKTLEETRLLRIEREEFFDLLADHVQITESILKASARRLRKVMSGFSTPLGGSPVGR